MPPFHVPEVPGLVEVSRSGKNEDLLDDSYMKQFNQEAEHSKDPVYLAKELKGERIVPVHGQGILAYSLTESDENIKKDAWKQHATHEHWLAASRARRDYWAKSGVIKPPLRWVLVEPGDDFDENALQTGAEASGEMLFTARSWIHGGLHPGKAGRHLREGAMIPYGSLAYPVDTYEILVGDPSSATWIEIPRDMVLNVRESPPTPTQSLYSHLSPKLSFIPVECGREADGKCLLVAQAFYEGGWHPGKAGVGDDHCCVAYAGGEVWMRSFRILAYAL